jgi:hypothetical protein
MDKWEYTHRWIENPYGPASSNQDLAPSVMPTLNGLGADGWEICQVLEYWNEDDYMPPEDLEGGAWLVLLKRRASAA